MLLEAVWSKHHPFRVPDWRWLRADALYSQTDIPRCEDNDEYVVDLIEFLRKWRSEKPVPKEKLYAAELYTLEELSLPKWELEARILVNQSPEEISKLLDLPIPTIQLYERWCYDVRDKLQNKSYIYQCLIAPKIDHDHDFINKEIVWKTYALFGDVDILNQVIFDCHTNINKEQFWLDELLNTAIRRLAVVNRFGKLAPKQVLAELSKLYAALTKATKTTTIQQVNVAGIEEVAESILSSIKWDWSEAKQPDKVMLVGQASLTGTELLQLKGNPPGKKFTEFLETAKFPEE